MADARPNVTLHIHISGVLSDVHPHADELPAAAMISQGQGSNVIAYASTVIASASAVITCCSAVLCGPACVAGLVKRQHAGEGVRLLEAEAKHQRHMVRWELRIGQSPQRLDRRLIRHLRDDSDLMVTGMRSEADLACRCMHRFIESSVNEHMLVFSDGRLA
jgi:hypothetical protein